MSPRILILALSSFSVGTQAFVFVGLLDRIAADLGVSVPAAGQLATLYALAFAICAPVLGALAAGLERRRLLVGALTLLTALNLTAGFAPDYGTLALIRVACGAAATLIVPVAAAAAASLAPPEARGRALSVVIGGMTLALVAGIPLGSVVGDLFGWRACFAFAASLSAAAAIAIRIVLPPAPSADRPGLGTLSVARERPVALHLAVTFASLAAAFCVITYVAPMVSLVAGLSGAGVGLMQACSGVGAMAGVALGGRASDGPAPGRAAKTAFGVLLVTHAAQAVLMLTAPDIASQAASGAPPHPIRAAAMGATLFASTGSMFFITPILQRRLAALAPRSQAVAIALNGSMVFFGQAAGGAIGGAAIALAGLPWIAAAGFVITLAALGLFAAADRAASRAGVP